MSASSVACKLVVGLGNPGPKYAETRHNAGFWFLDALAERNAGDFHPEKRFFGDYTKVRIAGHDVHLLKPTTFMNHSGRAIQAVANFFKIGAEQIVVVHDELDLPPGVIRLKQSGGHGGHNGLRDTIAQVGRDFWRIRLGIGHPGHKDDVVGFVLKRAPQAEQSLIDEAIDAGLGESERWVSGDLAQAMQVLHARKPG
ncbi:MAG TPA: aminoacyl-tRNA hydrolase [Gammaproteobacteria bacterium]|nr:aminoacyl-tRNA hydrolase [Gammaproteobacteria bacterium]